MDDVFEEECPFCGEETLGHYCGECGEECCQHCCTNGPEQNACENCYGIGDDE